MPLTTSLIGLWYSIGNSASIICSQLINFLALVLHQFSQLVFNGLNKNGHYAISDGQNVSAKCSSELTIVLDLDETLVYATNTPPLPFEYDYFTIISEDNTPYYVYKRPYLDYFLKSVSLLGRVIVFTASEKSYATQVIANLGQEGKIEQAYYRDVILSEKIVMQSWTIRLHQAISKYRTKPKENYCNR